MKVTGYTIEFPLLQGEEPLIIRRQVAGKPEEGVSAT